jgi:hypothetical protein
MAADLGAVYVREGDLQQVADVAARAGAFELARWRGSDDPGSTETARTMDAARHAATDALCAGIDTTSHGPWANVCRDRSWASDGNSANGEVWFYTGSPDPERGFAGRPPASRTTSRWITGIRVLTPPLRVEFGLAAAFTVDHTDLQKAATAGVFTVLPRAGALPFVLAQPNFTTTTYCAATSLASLPSTCPSSRTSTSYLVDGTGASLQQSLQRGYPVTLTVQATRSLSGQASALRDGLWAPTSSAEPGRLVMQPCPAQWSDPGPGAFWDPALLRCGRLGVLFTSTSTTRYRFGSTVMATSYRLFWIEGYQEWRPWGARTVQAAITGRVLDPNQRPTVITDKDAVRPLDSFLGTGLPATVRLLRDVSDPPAR